VTASPGARRVTIEWLMRGTNTGPLRADLPPTGAVVALPGIDVIALDAEGIASVRGYFDQQALFAQLGLQIIVQPFALGPVSFGRALRLSSGNQAKPAAFSTTWIDVPTDAERDEVIERTRQMFAELVQMPGFIAATFTNIAGRLTTQTAWESEDAARAFSKLPNHKAALARFFSGELGVAVQTSVWVPSWQNALWVRCAACGRVEAHENGGHSACGEPFPEQPSYW
jgi:heme-degrading monooxygenase HmoA